MFAITKEQREKVVGYSALSRSDHKYICVDGATYVAGSDKDMEKYLEDSLLKKEDYLIDRESVSDLLHDYGDTQGSYALELEALSTFKSVADKVNIHYHSDPYESFASEDPELFIVEIEE